MTTSNKTTPKVSYQRLLEVLHRYVDTDWNAMGLRYPMLSFTQIDCQMKNSKPFVIAMVSPALMMFIGAMGIKQLGYSQSFGLNSALWTASFSRFIHRLRMQRKRYACCLDFPIR